MSFKLSKEELITRAKHVEALNTAWGKVEDAISHYNDRVTELRDEVEKTVGAYNEVVNEVRGFAEDVYTQADQEISDKSERWQEGDKGVAAIEWKTEWENASFDELSIEFPEELNVDVPDHATDLEGLPDEASGL